MKKSRLIAILIVIGFIAAALGSHYYRTGQKSGIARRLPSFEVRTLEGRTVRDDVADQRAYTLIMYFHTDCEFCQEEVKSLIAEQSRLSDVSVLLVSPEPINILKDFAQQTGLPLSTGFIVAQDEKGNMPDLLDLHTAPTTILYRGRNEVKRFEGQILAPGIIKAKDYSTEL